MGLIDAPPRRRTGAAGDRARAARQAVQRPRVEIESVFRFREASLSALGAMGAGPGAQRRGARPTHPQQGRALRSAEHQRAGAIEFPPATENVLRTPLLIVPPWINKFYILDLKPEKSFIKWCVDQGITVFVISWVNPDKSLGAKTFDDYMKEGPLAAMDAIEQATGELKVHTMGYCVGGTLLASTLAWLAEKRRVRVTSATFLPAQADFSHAGDLLGFVDEGQISALERDMQATGVLEGSKMAMAFNMLRSNDLIWSYVVSNYLNGQPPSAFDLLH